MQTLQEQGLCRPVTLVTSVRRTSVMLRNVLGTNKSIILAQQVLLNEYMSTLGSPGPRLGNNAQGGRRLSRGQTPGPAEAAALAATAGGPVPTMGAKDTCFRPWEFLFLKKSLKASDAWGPIKDEQHIASQSVLLSSFTVSNQ